MRAVLLLVIAAALAAPSHALASLKFDSREVELKAAPADEHVTAEFAFENAGDGAVVIKSVESSCGCLTAEADKRSYAPGDRGTIRGVFKLGRFTGHQKKYLTVLTEDNQTTRLQVGVQIPDVIKISPDVVEWTLGEKPAPKSFKIEVAYPEPVAILDITPSRPGFEAELKTIEEGREYEIVLTPESTSKAMLGMLRITTNCAIKKHQRQMAFFAISRPKPQAGAKD